MDPRYFQKFSVTHISKACNFFMDPGKKGHVLLNTLSLFLNMLFSAYMCPYGMQYKPCGPPCQQNCDNIGDEPEEHCKTASCVEGCFCPNGTVVSGKLHYYCPSTDPNP